VVLQLDKVGARVLTVDGLPKFFLGLWWHIAVGIEDGLPVVEVAGIEVVDFGSVAEMGTVGYGGGVAVGTGALDSASIGEGSQCCTKALQALLSPC
jgi:hypothetical protein